jgi:L-threonylcarbamoyladenylate synthase
METQVVQIDNENLQSQEMKVAAEILRAGGLVAFPTETVYGLGGNALDETAAARIYQAKGRPSDNPLIVHIAELQQVYELAEQVSESAKQLMDAFWPGPLTIIFPKKDCVPYGTTGGLDTVAIRMPSHPVAQALIRQSGVCIAAPSANASGRPSPTKAEHVRQDLDGKIPMILDGGEVGIGIESTIVDVTGSTPMILRPGFINQEMLEAVVGTVTVDPAILSKPVEGVRPKAPGMMYRHYAPKGDLVVYDGEQDKVIRYINKMVKEKQAAGLRVGVIATSETEALYEAGYVVSIGTRQDEDTIARHLYDVLRQMDEANIDFICCEAFHTKKLGTAIMNRLCKAAGYHIECVGKDEQVC